ELTRAYVQAHLVDRQALEEAQAKCDPLLALATLKQAFTTDVSPILAIARGRAGGALDPIETYRRSGYRGRKSEERPAQASISAGNFSPGVITEYGLRLGLGVGGPLSGRGHRAAPAFFGY